MDISGLWYNELTSQVEFQVNGNRVIGKYWTAVGDAVGEYSLIGQINNSNNLGQVIGFVVLWQNEFRGANAVTTWSGQVQLDDNGDETIVTTWLLTLETDVDSDWKSTLIGKDTFTRNPQNKNQYKNSEISFPKNLK